MNNIKELYNNLINDIKNIKINPFDEINIITPSNMICSYLKFEFLKNNNKKVLMNINIISINDFIFKILKLDDYYSIISNEFLIYLIIKNIKNNNDFLPNNIKEYINDENHLFDFANNLSPIYLKYDKSDELDNLDSYQKELYKLLEKDFNEFKCGTISFIYKQNKGFNKINNLYFFGFFMIDKIYENIINDYKKENEIKEYNLKYNDDYKINYYSKFENKILACPSKIREIEILHTNICKILEEDKNIKYNDILVLSPDIASYKSAISSVFRQDGINYPNIPFSIYALCEIKSDETSALKILIDIINKKYFTRTDFISLASNKIVMNVRGINEEDLDEFKNALINTNTYRQNERYDDWDYLRKRIILSKITDYNLDFKDNITKIDNVYYQSYDSLFLSDEIKTKILSLIDDLNEFIKLDNNIKSFDDINKINDILRKFICVLDDNDNISNYYYKKINNIINYFENMDFNLSLNIFLRFLFDSSKRRMLIDGNPFTKGVTFTNLSSNIIYSKYIFIIGANSINLPKDYTKSELECDIDINSFLKEKEEKSFYLQASNTDNLIISYINKDLIKDAELFKSPFVNNIEIKKLGYKDEQIEKHQDEINHKIDETRSWDEIYTLRSKNNKDSINNLFNEEEKEKNIINFNIKKEEKFNVSNLADFLKEPLKFKYEFIFKKDYSNDDKIENSYEQFDIDNLSKSIIINKMILNLLISYKEGILFDKYEFKNELKINHELSYILESIEDNEFEDLYKKSLDKYNLITKEETILSSNINYNLLPDLSLNYYILVCNKEMISVKDNNTISYYDLKELKDSDDFSNYTDLYIYSLLDIALKNDEKEYDCFLIKSKKKSVEFKINSIKAKEILNNIYNLIYEYDNMAFPINLIRKKEITYDKYKESILDTNGKGDWSYFDDKDMFDLDYDILINEDNFNLKFEEYKNKILDLVLFIK